MMTMRTRWLAGLGIACLWGGAAGAEDSPNGVLEAKGLRKAGLTYILPAEADVTKLANVVRKAQQRLVDAIATQQAVEGQVDANKSMVVEFTQQRRLLRQQMAMASSVAERNQYVIQSNELGDRINLLYEGKEGEQAARKEVAAKAAGRREAFVQALLELSTLVEETEKQYAELKGDDAVKVAIEALNRGVKANAKVALGPTKAYQANVKALKKAQGAIQSESIPLQDSNGTFLVDVTLNGKVTRAMTFDTGAGIVSLPAALAAQAGLKPTQDTPTIRLQAADGSVHEGKLMTLKSVRVGKFTVENVECAVMGADLPNAPPLLGGSFLKYFTYKLVPEAGKLTLSKVAAGDAETPKRPARGATRKAAAAKAEAP